MADSSLPKLAEPRTANPFGSIEPARQSGLVAVDQQRAIAEVQARIVVAHHNRRDPVRAADDILNHCTRVTLAEKALYHYARGGTDIEGPSIRLAEVLIQCWGNLQCGVAEVARHEDYSECIAYAWDLQSNTFVDLKFQVRHWRDTRQGGYKITDERDIYEAMMNQGARRKRACILSVVPGDIVEAAVDQCKRTLIAKADTSPEAVKKLVDAFAELGVSQQQIEARIQRRLEAIRPAQVVTLRSVYNSIKDGVADIADHFAAVPLEEKPGVETTPPPASPQQPARGRGRPARTRNTETTTDSKPPDDRPPPSPPPPPGRGFQFEV